jgi:hypothetical protein
LSIGGTQCLEDAGSFAGFCLDGANNVYAVTAAHCVPGVKVGDRISCPSSYEITARLDEIVPYTQYQDRGFRINPDKDAEATGILEKYSVSDNQGGVKVKINGETRVVCVEGPVIGALKDVVFDEFAGLLAQHNEKFGTAQ